jgi:hypothetical protein
VSLPAHLLWPKRPLFTNGELWPLSRGGKAARIDYNGCSTSCGDGIAMPLASELHGRAGCSGVGSFRARAL